MAEEKALRTTKPKKSQETKGRKSLWVSLSVLGVLILAVAGLVVYASGYEGIMPNTYIGECNVSGKSPQEALAILNDTYTKEKIAGGMISISCRGNQADLVLDDMNIVFENQASVDNAMQDSKQKNVFAKTWNLTRHLLTRTTVQPVLSYDKGMLEEAVVQVAGEHEVEPVNYSYEIKKDQVILHGKVDGKKVDRVQLAKDLERKICAGDFSDIAVEPVAITPKELNFDEFYQRLTAPAEDAYYEKGEDGMVRVHPGKLQCQVDKETVKSALEAVDSATDNKTTFPVITTEPEKTEEALTQQLYQDVLGTYTTYYSGSAARNNNVQLATSRINGLELMPGDEFSYDKTILPRTYANGYQSAPVYVGNKVESGLGGGICQPSSTLYGAVLYANMEILERHNHSMLVGYMPAGLDATIAQGYLDFRFKNSSDYPIKIEATASGGKLTFSILGYNPENISVEIIRSGGGYYYTATRVVYQDGVEIAREALGASRYSPKEEEPEEEEKEETEGAEGTEGEETPEGAGETTPEQTPEGTEPPNQEQPTSPMPEMTAPTPTPTPAPAPEVTAPAPAPEMTAPVVE